MPKTKTKEPQKPSREEARRDALYRLIETLNASPLNSLSKEFVSGEFNRTHNRMLALKLNSKKWHDLDRDELWKEYKIVEKHFKNLTIFSNEFYMMLNNRWNDLLNTYNPNVDWYSN